MSTATVTGKVMGAITQTSKVYNNARGIFLDFDRQTARVLQSTDTVDIIDISAATTITATAASGVYSITIS